MTSGEISLKNEHKNVNLSRENAILTIFSVTYDVLSKIFVIIIATMYQTQRITIFFSGASIWP